MEAMHAGFLAKVPSLIYLITQSIRTIRRTSNEIITIVRILQSSDVIMFVRIYFHIQRINIQKYAFAWIPIVNAFFTSIFTSTQFIRIMIHLRDILERDPCTSLTRCDLFTGDFMSAENHVRWKRIKINRRYFFLNIFLF